MAFGHRTNWIWRRVVLEERNRFATEIHDMLVPGRARMLRHLEAAACATQSGQYELLRSAQSGKNNCLFFEPSKSRTSCNEALQSDYSLKPSTFCIPRPVGTATAKPTFVCDLHSTS